MGINNRQRRAAKARRRTHSAPRQPRVDPSRGPDQDAPANSEAARAALRALVVGRARGTTSGRIDLAYFQMAPEHQQGAVDTQLAELLRAVLAAGWTPQDLHEVTRRRLDAGLVAYLGAALAAPGGAAGSLAWSRTAGLAWPQAHTRLIDLLVLLASLPDLGGVPNHRPAAVASHADDSVLRKVRALLAKAESTEYAEEAEALTAKAQQLISAHSIDRALADAAASDRDVPVARRIWLDAPYVGSKVLVIDAVAASNHVRSVFVQTWGFVTIVGHEPDLDTVELLSTSLLVQATRTMTALGSQISRSGTSHTRSFRQSFLTAFAQRIAERLREAATDAESQADDRLGGSVLPVLASRDAAVDDVLAALFPRTVSRRVQVSNAAGWGAGRAAADLAQLDVRRAVSDRDVRPSA